MPFGYSSKLFAHPAIEYIPLLPLESRDILKIIPYSKAGLYLVPNKSAFETIPAEIRLDDFTVEPDKELGLLLVNACIETIKYRGNYVSVVASITPGKHQVVKILSRYFYKPDLIFQLLDANGTVHAQRQLSVPIKR